LFGAFLMLSALLLWSKASKKPVPAQPPAFEGGS